MGHRETLIWGKRPWIGRQQQRCSRSLGGMMSHVTPRDGRRPGSPEASRKEPQGDRALDEPHAAMTRVPTGWDSDHGLACTCAEAPRGDHVTDRFTAAATPPPPGTTAPAPRAPAARVRRTRAPPTCRSALRHS